MFLDKSITIRIEPDALFPWLAPARTARWDPAVVRAGALDGGALTVGTRFHRIVRALGHRFESHFEATAVEPGRLLSWRQLSGDYDTHRGAYVLEPVDGGTRLRMLAEVELPFVLPCLVAESDVRSALSHDADVALYNLKDLAERRRPMPFGAAAMHLP